MATLITLLIWTLFGLIVGTMGWFFIPGRPKKTWLGAAGAGIAGAILGGLLTFLIRGGDVWQPPGFVMSLVGAVIILSFYVSTFEKSRTGRKPEGPP